MAMTPFRKPAAARVEPFDVNRIEDDIRDELTRSAPPLNEYAPPVHDQAAAPPVDLAAITAEAINSAHEAAASALSSLGSELSERIKQLDALRLEAEAALKDVLDTAEAYRKRGPEVAEKISSALKLTTEVRESCKTLRDRLGQ